MLKTEAITTALADGLQQAADYEADRIAEWLEALSRHPACTQEKRFWYEGVAADIRTRVPRDRL